MQTGLIGYQRNCFIHNADENKHNRLMFSHLSHALRGLISFQRTASTTLIYIYQLFLIVVIIASTCLYISQKHFGSSTEYIL